MPKLKGTSASPLCPVVFHVGNQFAFLITHAKMIIFFQTYSNIGTKIAKQSAFFPPSTLFCSVSSQISFDFRLFLQKNVTSLTPLQTLGYCTQYSIYFLLLFPPLSGQPISLCPFLLSLKKLFSPLSAITRSTPTYCNKGVLRRAVLFVSTN